MDILIKNGMIINADKSEKADVFISGGIIAEVHKSIAPHSDDTKIIDASNKYIFPGGIDPHVHLNLPGPAGFSSDDFYTGSKAALYGGTTSFIDFVTPHKGQRLPEALDERKKEAGSSLTDHYFHVSPIEWRDSIPAEIKRCVEKGIRSFKIYMAYLDTIGLKDNDIQKVMKAVADAGGIIIAHCELGEEVDELRKTLIENGHSSPDFHPVSRPNYVEAEAVKKVIDFAAESNCPIYIVHVSTKESLEHIRKAQQKGQKVYAETCPQYLLLDDSKYLGIFEQTAPFVISPPLRKKADNEALWQAIADGTIQTIGTDHCPFMFEQKKFGYHDFTKIPNGAGGIEHRLALIYTYGVLEKKISLNRMVEIVSTQAAKIFGLYPKKGEIRKGADADLVIWNPKKENTISCETHHQNCDINIYEGMGTFGSAEYVIAGGKIVICNGGFIRQ